MLDNGYQVIFLGQILNGFDESEVRKNLMPHFKGKVDHLFEKAPLVIKKDLSYEQAQDLTDKMIHMGVMCKVFSPPEEDEIELEMESKESSEVENIEDHTSSTDPEDPIPEEYDTFDEEQTTTDKNVHAGSKMVCPSCGFVQEKAEECIQCGVIIEKFQDTKKEKDVFQDYIDQMSQMPSTGPERDKTTILLTFMTILIVISIILLFGWSFHFFVYQKPWRNSDVESIIVTPIETTNTKTQKKIKSQKETIEKLKQALQAKKQLSEKLSSKSSGNFSLKSIPLPFLKHYQGKYVWVTCENGAVHQGTLYAIYAEQIILKKTRFNLTIPINRSMIKIVEYDLRESDYDDDAVEAYLSYKRRTEEALQHISTDALNHYIGKNLQIYLNSGQLYEGILTKCEQSKITIENIIYGQLVTFVIQKGNIDRVLY
jgi:small nuclear ribonucleoprotein (snRNP)-like protein